MPTTSLPPGGTSVLLFHECSRQMFVVVVALPACIFSAAGQQALAGTQAALYFFYNMRLFSLLPHATREKESKEYPDRQEDIY